MVPKADLLLCPSQCPPEVAFVNLRAQDVCGVPSHRDCVLVDEIHLFGAKELYALCNFLELIEPRQLFISVLPGSFNQEPFGGSADVLARADLIVCVPGQCVLCGSHSFRSTKLTSERASAGDILVGKQKFGTLCFECCQNPDNQFGAPDGRSH